jgi:phosphate butyryltransferase
MKLDRLADLFEYAKSDSLKTLVAVNAVDSHSLEAISEAVNRGLIKAIITGNRNEILNQCSKANINPDLFQIIDAGSEEEAAELAVEQVANHSGQILMKGLISSNKFLKAILKKKAGLLPSGGVLSHVSVIDNSNYHKLLIVSDVAIIPYPSISQKIVMINYLKEMAQKLGVENPRIAIIAPTEQVLPNLISSADAAEIMKSTVTGLFKPAIVFGPMALDVAVDIESARIKNITSEVAGDADCLLFPNIDAGNVFYKTNTKLCGADQAAVVMGASVSIVLSSRGDSIDTKLNSIALAVLLSK